MRWFLGLNHAAPHFVAYARMVQAAMLSAPKEGGLQPHLLFDGSECDLTRWFRNRGGEVIFRESYLKPDLLRLLHIPEVAAQRLYVEGVYLRAEIPALMKERGWMDEIVLYTDNDILFTPLFRAADLPRRLAHPIAAAPESDRNDEVIFNSGFMLLNLPRWEPIYARFKQQLIDDLPMALRGDWDQFTFRAFFGKNYDRLDPVWNWKPYWGPNPAARVIHFHGPKPFLREQIRQGTALPVQLHLATGEFWRACEEFDRLLAAAGL